jgi:hypothetical protein
MSGETNLTTLLQSMQPAMQAEPYVFASLSAAEAAALPVVPLMLFRETEGVTLIITQADADRVGVAYSERWALIILTVHSSLTAVGFLAAISARLAAAGISLNAVSAYYHDHLFVPWEAREQALAQLAALRS